MAARSPRKSAAPYLPSTGSLKALREASGRCRGCDLYERATQTVFGEGSPRAKVVLVGEQPGDQEDLAGRPFVGPAGRVLSEALAAAGLSREEIYVTNAVKHFKWTPRGKRRMHQRPQQGEVLACRPWLEAEVAAIQPRVIVCLGATAAQSFFGASFRITEALGKALRDARGRTIVVAYHPSAILRMQTDDERSASRRSLVDSLALARDIALGDDPARDEASAAAPPSFAE
ncbi:MAG: UdgX family uracil-DNA binding protein [Myxococcales bacterium]|nr:UdgX family uracil-DNA binding protein [Myxococcales bacterium]